jgi:magnesium chelatase family protein
MIAQIETVAFAGIDVLAVNVQVQIAQGMPSFTIVGLPDKAVAESRERVRAALHSLGIALPAKRVLINLAPADIAKEGSHYDLPIALALLAAMDLLPRDIMAQTVALGELSLDGHIRAVTGVLPAALYAQQRNISFICPKDCGSEAAWVGGQDVLAPAHLLEIINHMKGTQLMTAPRVINLKAEDAVEDNVKAPDISMVKGQEAAKRALEITAAGGHNLLMVGPPGAGKSLLAACLPGIMPALTPSEALEVSMIHSLAGTLPTGGLMRARPYRDPHYSATMPALIGGGAKIKPGEISLAHGGILFLDEMPEFARATLEALRQPLETGRALVARAERSAVYPARFQLVGAMNPCRCGYMGDDDRQCHKAPLCGRDYQSKLSGPLLDRMDLKLDVVALSVQELTSHQQASERSETVRARVTAAQLLQRERNNGLLNAQLDAAQSEQLIILDEDAKALIMSAAERLKLSARGYHRLLRVAQTIADLDLVCQGAREFDLAVAPVNVRRTHMAEALSYRTGH